MKKILLSITIIISFIFLSCTKDENFKKWFYEDDEEEITLILYGNNKGEWQIKEKSISTIYGNIFPINYTKNEIIINNLFEKYEYYINNNELIAKLFMTKDFNNIFYFDNKDFKEYIFKNIVINNNAPIIGKWESVEYHNNLIMELLSDYSGKEYYNNNEPFDLVYTIFEEIHFGVIYDGSITIKYVDHEIKYYYKIQGSEMLVTHFFPHYEVYKKLIF